MEKTEAKTSPTLNGTESTYEKIEEKKKDQAVRIVETKPGEFKELKKLHG